ncbi:50S ribosomal protein L13 [Methanothrix harundinacea]
MMIIDASGMILGRLASLAASELLAGEEIAIVNAEKAIISGRRETIYREYEEMKNKGSTEKGPHYPKRPERILKRTVRGMLPHKTKRGRDAMSRLRIYVGVPPELKGMEMERPEAAKMTRLGTGKYVELGDVSRMFGSKF